MFPSKGRFLGVIHSSATRNTTFCPTCMLYFSKFQHNVETSLNLIGCKKLKNLPERICCLKPIETLNIFSCSKLGRLVGKHMEALTELGANGTAIKQLPLPLDIWRTTLQIYQTSVFLFFFTTFHQGFCLHMVSQQMAMASSSWCCCLSCSAFQFPAHSKIIYFSSNMEVPW